MLADDTGSPTSLWRGRADASFTGAPDDELVGLAAAGSDAAFAELYRRHAPDARRVAFAVTDNRHDAADATNEAFAGMLQALATGRLRDTTRFRAYLLAASRNAAIDIVRRSGRSTPTGEVDDLDRPNAHEPSRRMLEDLDSSLVSAAFTGLPKRWRTVLWLTEVEGLRPREAALRLGLTPNGTSQLAVRARAALRRRFLETER